MPVVLAAGMDDVRRVLGDPIDGDAFVTAKSLGTVRELLKPSAAGVVEVDAAAAHGDVRDAKAGSARSRLNSICARLEPK